MNRESSVYEASIHSSCLQSFQLYRASSTAINVFDKLSFSYCINYDMKLKFVERGDEYFTNIVSSDVYGDTENENNNRQDCVTNS